MSVSRVTNDTETLFEFWYVFLMVLTGIFAVVSSFLPCFKSMEKLPCGLLVLADFRNRHLVLPEI